MSPAIEELDETTEVAEPLGARWLPVSYFDPLFAEYVEGEIERLRRLEAGWDGYGALPVHADIIQAAKALVRGLSPNIAPRPRVVPLSSGGLQIEWTAGNVALELEFESPFVIRYLKWNPTAGEPEEQTVPVGESDQVEALIRWFSQQDV
jgi:hypothetical protein